MLMLSLEVFVQNPILAEVVVKGWQRKCGHYLCPKAWQHALNHTRRTFCPSLSAGS